MVPASRHLTVALSDAVRRVEDGMGSVTLPSPQEADPATVAALNASVIDHGELAPVRDTSSRVLGAFGRACGHGWAIGAMLLGGVLRYSGEDSMDGIPGECTPALLSRASSYSTGEILQGVADVGFFQWTVSTREDPEAVDALVGTGRVSRGEAIGLLGGAVAAGFAIACSEFEFFTEPVDEGVIAYVESDLGPHHHRFDYSRPVLLADNDGAQSAYACTRSECRVLRTAPPSTPHEHRFDRSLEPVSCDGRAMWPCAEPGCGSFGVSAA